MMRSLFSSFFLFFSLFFSAPLFAVVADNSLKIAIVNFEKVIQESKINVYIQKNVDEKREELQVYVEKFEVKLREKESHLKDLQNKNDPSVSKAKTDFENKVTDVQNSIKARSKILSRVFGEARNRVTTKVMDIIKDIAEKQGYTLFLPSSVVIYQNGHDITEKVAIRLDKEMPTIEIDFSELSDLATKKDALND